MSEVLMVIYKAKTTDKAKKLGVIITDLGCVPPEDHEFLITEERAKVLSGDNKYNVSFIKDLIPVGNTITLVQEEVKPKKKAAKKKEDK